MAIHTIAHMGQQLNSNKGRNTDVFLLTGPELRIWLLIGTTDSFPDESVYGTI